MTLYGDKQKAALKLAVIRRKLPFSRLGTNARHYGRGTIFGGRRIRPHLYCAIMQSEQAPPFKGLRNSATELSVKRTGWLSRVADFASGIRKVCDLTKINFVGMLIVLKIQRELGI